MGSPQVSASVLDALFSASSAPDSLFESLEPKLCVTAAYGNILPSKFLKIPSLGTVNIHPSLLPLYRGAAPVQRALEETGVSVAFTVRRLDAGPVIARESIKIDDHIKAPELLELLFTRGSELLVRELPSIIDESARRKAEEQDESKATLAPKVTPKESWLSFNQGAITLHNKAFAGWPGARARVMLVDSERGQCSTTELKIITTRVYSGSNAQGIKADDVLFTKDSLLFPCGGQTTLEVLEVQLSRKKVVNASAFWNGLRGQKLKRI